VKAPPLAQRTRRTVSLVRMLAPREFRIRYRQSVLDVGWALLSPIVIAATYGYILTRSFDVSGGCAPYASSAWLGLVLWTFFATSVGTAVTSLIASGDLVTKIYFPREAIPLSMTVATLADLAVGLVTVLPVALVQGVSPGVTTIAVLLPLAVLLVWTAAISILVGVVAAFARDLVHGVHLALRVGFFATPVVYDASLLPPAFAWSADANPIAAAITGAREALLCGEWPSWGLLSLHLLLGILLLVALVAYTRSVEARIADVV
jgi:lipopolysaccharide transport system permease protein